MGNAIKLLKTRILKLPGHFSEAEAKKSLIEDIDKFIQVSDGSASFLNKRGLQMLQSLGTYLDLEVQVFVVCLRPGIGFHVVMLLRGVSALLKTYGVGFSCCVQASILSTPGIEE